MLRAEGHYATLHELQTLYGLEDLWTFLELITVENHNRNLYMSQE